MRLRLPQEDLQGGVDLVLVGGRVGVLLLVGCVVDDLVLVGVGVEMFVLEGVKVGWVVTICIPC